MALSRRAKVGLAITALLIAAALALIVFAYTGGDDAMSNKGASKMPPIRYMWPRGPVDRRMALL